MTITDETALGDGAAETATGTGTEKGQTATGFKPRGAPFQKGSDPRRKQEQQKQDGNGEGEAEQDEAEKQDGEGEGKGKEKEGKGKGKGNGNGALPFATFVTHGFQAADMMLAAIMQQQLEAAKEAVQEALVGPTTKVVIKKGKGVPPVVTSVKGKVHKCFPEIMDTIAAGLRNLLLVGPAGSGKTTLARQVTEALNIPVPDHPIARAIAAKMGGVPFASQSCSGGVTESVFIGRLLPTGEHGRFEYHPTPFVVLLEHGGGYLKDEVDAADANVLLISNSAIDNGHLDLPNRVHDPVARRHERHYLFLAANTFGMGANRQYVGRNQLDAAYLDRFAGAIIEMGYDRELEEMIVRQYLAVEAATAWLTKAWVIWERIEQVALRRIWGTRSLKHGARLLAHGMNQTTVLKRLSAGWSADEKQKAGLPI